ncbi:MAG: ABC transporter permease [Allobranchiibius sp.]
MSTFFADGLTVARRNLIKIKRVPDLLVFTTMQPIMFVLLFGFIFGSLAGAGNASGYREFLIAGIFAQTVIFGATITGSAMAEDMQKGIIDRFRTLPMHPGAVLFGRTICDLLNNVIVLVVMSLTGLVIGWRIRTGVLEAAWGFIILLVFAYAVSWVFAYVGLKVRTPEIFNSASFLVIFPLTFIANTFTNAQALPGALKVIAGWNPVSTITQSAREHFGNLFALKVSDTDAGQLKAIKYTWALEHSDLYTLIWVVALLAIFVPLSTATYKRAVAK